MHHFSKVKRDFWKYLNKKLKLKFCFLCSYSVSTRTNAMDFSSMGVPLTEIWNDLCGRVVPVEKATGFIFGTAACSEKGNGFTFSAAPSSDKGVILHLV